MICVSGVHSVPDAACQCAGSGGVPQVHAGQLQSFKKILYMVISRLYDEFDIFISIILLCYANPEFGS